MPLHDSDVVSPDWEQAVAAMTNYKICAISFKELMASRPFHREKRREGGREGEREQKKKQKP